MTSTIDTRTAAEKAYDAQKNGAAYVKPSTIAAVTVAHGSCDDTYSAGLVELSKQHGGYMPPDLTPWGLEIAGQDIRAPWTLATLQQLHTDLGLLLSDARVVAAFDEDDDTYTPLSPAWEAVLDITDDPTNNGRKVPIVRSRDAAHREERLIAILERIAELDETGQSEMLGYALGLFDGMAAKETAPLGKAA
jgi:hypothetical protein